MRGIFFIHFLPLNCYFKPQLHLPRFWKLALKAGRNRIAVIQLRSQWRNCDVNIENYWCNLAKTICIQNSGNTFIEHVDEIRLFTVIYSTNNEFVLAPFVRIISSAAVKFAFKFLFFEFFLNLIKVFSINHHPSYLFRAQFKGTSATPRISE